MAPGGSGSDGAFKGPGKGWIFGPTKGKIGGVLMAARRIGMIQTGSIHTYLAYSFFTLILLLWVVT